jgi:dienelactone hydrolase
MFRLSFKERFVFKFIFGNKIYQRWYGRFLFMGIDYGRLKRVIFRVHGWLQWCREWSIEGDLVCKKAEEALAEGYSYKAKTMFHEAVACYHIGQHTFFIDESQKETAQAKARSCYQKAISLYSDDERPIPVHIPFKEVEIPGYLRLAKEHNRPLIIFINGMDNIKEAEGHWFGSIFQQHEFNYLTFDGPGQGEMWHNLKFDVHEYPKAVSAIIDWFEKQSQYKIDLQKIGLVGFSLGGYLAPLSAAYDPRVKCVVGNSGLVYIGALNGLKRLNPIWQRGVTYMTGTDTLSEAVEYFNWDIEDAPKLYVPLLFFHAGKDEVMPDPDVHAAKIMKWAQSEKILRYYEDGEHCTMNYLDEVFPEIIDWFKHKLN